MVSTIDTVLFLIWILLAPNRKGCDREGVTIFAKNWGLLVDGGRVWGPNISRLLQVVVNTV